MNQQKVNIRTAGKLKKFLQEVVFIELKKDLPFWPMSLPMPVSVDHMASQIKNDDYDTIPANAVIDGLATIIGADPDFKYNPDYFKALVNLSDDFFGVVLARGLQYAEDGKYLEAILYFNAVLVVEEDNVNALFNMGRAFNDLYKETEDKTLLPFIKHCFERTSQLEPTFGLAFYALGFFYYNEEHYLEAETSWIKALNLDISIDIKEEIVEALGKVRDFSTFERGKDLILNGRYDEGLEHLKSIEELHDDWWQLNFFIGFALRMQEAYEDALPYFLKVLSLNTGSVQAMNEAGICLIALRDYDQALDYYKEALRLSPQNPEYICNRGIVYYHMKAYDDAFIQFETAHELAPEDEVITMWYNHIQKYVEM